MSRGLFVTFSAKPTGVTGTLRAGRDSVTVSGDTVSDVRRSLLRAARAAGLEGAEVRIHAVAAQVYARTGASAARSRAMGAGIEALERDPQAPARLDKVDALFGGRRR